MSLYNAIADCARKGLDKARSLFPNRSSHTLDNVLEADEVLPPVAPRHMAGLRAFAYAALVGVALTMLAKKAEAYTATQLTHEATWVGHPAWSPDGKEIVYIKKDSSGGLTNLNYDIYVMNADGSNQRRLTYTDDWEAFPTYSSDGQRIAFISSVRGLPPQKTSISIMDRHGTNITRIISDDGSYYFSYLSWSHDRKKLAFTEMPWIIPADSYVYYFDLDTSNLIFIAIGESPSWSPKDTEIAYARQFGEVGPTFVYKIDLLTTNTQVLAEGAAPDWGYKKDKITFNINNMSIGAMDANGSNITEIVKGNWIVFPKLSPDETKVVFFGTNDIFEVSGILRQPEITRFYINSSNAVIDAMVSPESLISAEHANNIYFTNSFVTNLGQIPNFGQGYATNQFIVPALTDSNSRFYRLLAAVTNQPVTLPADNQSQINAPDLKQEEQLFYRKFYKPKKDE